MHILYIFSIKISYEISGVFIDLVLKTKKKLDPIYIYIHKEREQRMKLIRLYGNVNHNKINDYLKMDLLS